MPPIIKRSTWQEYIDTLVQSGHVNLVSLHNLQGDRWEASKGFDVSKSEAQSLVRGFTNPSPLHENGIKLNGTTYTAMKIDKDYMFGKRSSSTSGCVVAKARTCIVIGVYDEQVQAAGCASIIVKLSDYLRECGF